LKLNKMLFVLAASMLLAAGVRAQDSNNSGSMPAAAPASAPAAAPATAPDAAPATAPMAKADKKAAKKAAWEAGVKQDCAAEIADGGVCAGKDFGTGLEKCLHMNRSKLSDGCKAVVHKHKPMHKKPAAAPMSDAAPAAAPASAPAATPAQ
jgi:hypothetical protein